MAALLLAAPAYAGPAANKWLSATGDNCPPNSPAGAFTINGYSLIYSDTGINSVSTGNARICTNAGNITVHAHCGTTSNGPTSSVTLTVDGSSDTVSCQGSYISKNVTLSRTVIAGPHNVSVSGTRSDSSADFSADTFTKP